MGGMAFVHYEEQSESRLAGLPIWINEFVCHLKKSTVDAPKLRQAFALKEANLPKCLYKYRSISDEPDDKSLSRCT
jgi:hypothetical protein